MSHLPGWYADPQTPPGQVPGVRWWDGREWTDAVHPGPRASVPPAAPTSGPTTPDGEPLAGWGARFAAYLIDGFLVFLVAAAVGAPFLGRVYHTYARAFREALRAADAGTARPNQMDVYGQVWAPLLAFVLVSIAVNFIYQVGFLRWRAATPGKMLLGMKVRLRERPGPLGWDTILRRWISQFGPNLLSLVPVLGLVAGLYPWLDGLWPLWDERRQALHDKFARTNVVKTRRTG